MSGNGLSRHVVADGRSGSGEPIPKKKWERVEPAPVRKIGKFYEV